MIILKVFIILLSSTVKIEFGILGLKAFGFSREVAILFSVSWAVIVTTLEYYSVNIVKRFLDKLLAKRKNHLTRTDIIWVEKVKKPIQKNKKKALKFLLDNKIVFSLLVVAIPFSLLLDPVAITAVRLSKLKFGLLYLIGATLIKCFLVIALI